MRFIKQKSKPQIDMSNLGYIFTAAVLSIVVTVVIVILLGRPMYRKSSKDVNDLHESVSNNNMKVQQFVEKQTEYITKTTGHMSDSISSALTWSHILS